MTRWFTLPLALTLTVYPAFAEKDKSPITDDKIHDQVLMKLAGDQEVKGGGFDVDVHGGVVTLKGKVDSERRKERAEKLVKHIKGVSGVENQLVVTK